MGDDELKVYDVLWGTKPYKHQRIRAESASDACSRIRERYGWSRDGTCLVDVATRGINCCEMPIWRENGGRTLLVAVLSQ